MRNINAGGGQRRLLNPLDFFQIAGLLQHAERTTDGIEHIHEQEGHVLVHVQDAVVCAVSFASGLVQRLQHVGENLEVLESPEIFVFGFISFFASHAGMRTRC